MGSLDFLILRKLIQRRLFGAFHYTFLIVLIVSFFVMANILAMEKFHPLAFLIRWYQRVSGDDTNRIWRTVYIWLGEFWSAAILSMLLAHCGRMGRRVAREPSSLGHRGVLAGRRRLAHCSSTGKRLRHDLGAVGTGQVSVCAPAGQHRRMCDPGRHVRVEMAEIGQTRLMN